MAGTGERPPAPAWPLVPDFRPDLYAGTAEDYDRHRPPYPPALIDDLLARAAPPPGGTLVDLACGTGQVARALAPRFAAVIAVDQEPDMVAVGRRRARAEGRDHVDWRVGRAEDVGLAPGSVALVTVGSAFHRLDRPLVARRARTWLAPGGSLAVLSAAEPTTGDAAWQAAVRRLAPPVPRATPGAPAGRGERRTHQAVLEDAGFVVTEHDFPTPHAWTADEIVGYLHSTSYASRRALGDRQAAYDAAVRAALEGCDPAGPYAAVVEFSYLLSRPAAAR